MKAFQCVAIVGVGLIGGSVGLAVRSRKVAKTVVGAGSRGATLTAAHKLGAISEVAADLKSAVATADLVVVCTPVGSIVEKVREIAPLCRPGTLITDAGSTKAQIVKELDRAAQSDPAWSPDVRFVGSHPLAGNEKKGPEHARADLFTGRTVIITPTPRTRSDDRQTLTDFWTALGARVLEMSGDDHDRALATTSHLPHLVAAAIAGSPPDQYVPLTASGWQDTTRIAAGDPLLWQQIMLANRTHLLAALDRLTTLLADWRTTLEASDAAALEGLLSEAKRIRDAAGN